ncbi:bifunctional 3-(3-hydroxy-phenyl)propionate/3-hydroxycinnamic acid hydroxylase [bacterium]|nr:bifunctional 3-(3-hydroxy-phenyl)propionate/3-hydroxycinnamic acid hydroxylase [bacterium]
MFDADVAIVGYGPSGVSAANFLGAYGIKTIVLERDMGVYQRARAVTVNDWTLRCYQSVGLDRELLKDMEPTQVMRWSTYKGRELARLKLGLSQIGQPTANMIYQPKMEQTLRAGVERYSDKVEVRFGAEVVGLEQDRDAVRIASKDIASGEMTVARVKYALACDGGSSFVRRTLGVPLIGSTLDTTWVVIDARVKGWWPNRHMLTFWTDRFRPVVDIPLALGNHRWEFPLNPDESEKDFETEEQLWTLLAELGIGSDQIEIHQSAFYKHHVRRAEYWRVGRVCLLGDAAHLMPPWAGQGMQSGIRDAFNISWKLREVLNGRLPETLLDTYEVERAPNVEMLTQSSLALGRLIKREMGRGEMIRTFITTTLSRLGLGVSPERFRPPSIARGWLSGAVGEKSAVGRMIPQPIVWSSRGQRGPLDGWLGDCMTMIGVGENPENLLSPEEKDAWKALGLSFLTLKSPTDRTGPEAALIDVDGTLLRWMRGYRTDAIILRPDRFVVASRPTGLGVPPCLDML